MTASELNIGVTYRPKVFGNVLGNKRTLTSLRDGVLHGRMGNALLFSGETGSGKTTLSYILARAVNCDNLRKDGSPCNKCDSCRDEGGMTYVDCALGGGKDAITALIASQRIAPVYKRRVVILDECHALTYGGTGSATAVLTAMEDPECKTLWLLCTNKPEKLSDAMRGRCTHYVLTPPGEDEFIDYMFNVLEQEWGELPADEDATDRMLQDLYTSTGGQVREALNALPLLYAKAKHTKSQTVIDTDVYLAKLLGIMLSPKPVDRFADFVKATHGLKAEIGAALDTQFGTLRAAIDNLIAYAAGVGTLYHPVAKRAFQDLRQDIEIDALLHATLALCETERQLKGVSLSTSADRSILISTVMLYLDKNR